MIDWAQVASLRDEVGEDGFEEVVMLFLEEVSEVLDRIEDPISPPDLEGDLHLIKGSALSLGFADFATLCQEGETAAGAGNPGAVDITALRTCFDLSRAALLQGHKAESAA